MILQQAKDWQTLCILQAQNNIIAQMATLTILLNKIFDTGNIIGPILCWVFILLMLIEVIYVWMKYVITSNK